MFKDELNVNFYYCTSLRVMEFLTEWGIPFVEQKPQKHNNRYLEWTYIRNEKLSKALTEYSRRKMEFLKSLDE